MNGSYASLHAFIIANIPFSHVAAPSLILKIKAAVAGKTTPATIPRIPYLYKFGLLRQMSISYIMVKELVLQSYVFGKVTLYLCSKVSSGVMKSYSMLSCSDTSDR